MISRNLKHLLGVHAACVVVGMAPALLAQGGNAHIVGTVTDSTGAAIPGATVTVTNTGTNATQTITSGGNGDFTVNALPIGTYHITAVMNGFATQAADVKLDVGEAQTLNFKLAVGSQNTTVDVTNEAPVIDLANSDTSEIITGQELTDLPLNGRNFTQLTLLQPGVSRGASNSQGSGYNKGQAPVETLRFNETGGAVLSANGLRTQANSFILDGVDDNESLVNTIVLFPDVEALAEFRATNSLAPAEFGRAGGVIVQAAIKSGTNQVHGSLYQYYRDSHLGSASQNYFSPQTPTPSFHRNQFGATLGGPLWKDHLFLFGNYHGSRQNIPNGLSLNTVPTAKMRTGDFSELLGSSLTTVPALYTGPGSYSPTGCAAFTTVHGITVTSQAQLNASVDNGAIFNPLTCSQFGTMTAPNVIPANQQNAVALKYLNYFPAPNRTPQSNVLNNYQNQQFNKVKDDEFDARLDWQIGNKDRFFVRGSTDNYYSIITTALVNVPSGYGSGNNDTRPRQIAAGETHLFSANIVNDAHFAFTRDFFSYLNPGNNTQIDVQLGIPNGNRNSFLGGISLIGDNNTQLSYTGDGGPYTVPEFTYEGNDSVSYAHGAHNMKFGADIIHREVDFFQAQYNAKGFFNMYSGAFTGYDTSELLGGFVNNYSISNPTGYYQTVSWETGYFAQDDWKVNHRLVLNLGIRYDLFTHPYEEQNRQSNYNIATNSLVEAGVNGNSRSLISTNFNNVAPRVGFAYDLYGDGKTSLRGGYGIYYFLDRGGVGNQLSNNPDFNGSGSYSSYAGYRINLSGQAPMIANSAAGTNGPGPYAGNNPQLATGTLPPATVSVNITNPQNVDLISYPVNSPTSMIQQYNMSLEQQFGARTSLTLAYVGTKSDHLLDSINYSTRQLGTGVYFGQSSGNSITLNETNGTSHYNGLQAKLDHQLSKGLQFTAAYTWSHTTDDTIGPFSQVGAGSVPTTAAGPQFNLNRGDSDNDIRNVFTFAMLGTLPVGRGQAFASNVNNFVNQLIGGWQIAPFVQLTSGSPFDIQINAPNGNSPTVRPNLLENNPYQKPTAANNYQMLRASDFSAPATNAAGIYTTVGNVHKNQFRSSNYSNLSVSLFKDFPIHREIKAQLRGQFYNVLNSPAFAPPSNTTLNDPPSSTATFANINYVDYFSQRLTELSFRIQF